MTQEEKARAYDEALTTAKRIISKNCSEVEKLCLKSIFPELAESEDERIRVELVALFKEMQDSAWHEKYWHDLEIDHILAYLEKQKDLDKMIVVSPEVWDKAISDAYENGKKDDEKQKEQKHWKPTETDVALFNKAVTTNNTLTPAERANLDIIRSKFGCCRAINCSGIMQKEQKPAEWNDTDMKEARANLISVCMDWERGKQTALLPIVAVRARYFLEHLTEPKPAEWSEELKNELAKKHLDGYIMGREDTMREMRDFLGSHFNMQSGTSIRQGNERH